MKRQAILRLENVEAVDTESMEKYGHPDDEFVRTSFADPDGIKFDVMFNYLPDWGEDGNPISHWDVEFWPSQSHGSSAKSKHPIQTLKNVAAAVLDFVNTHHPDVISFSGFTEKHDKAYMAMLKRLVPGKWEKVPGKFLVRFPKDKGGRQAILRPENIPEVELYPSPPNWEVDEFYGIEQKFTTSDGVDFYVQFDQHDGGSWDVSFGSVLIGKRSEHPTEVLGKVIAVIKKFIHKVSPERLTFVGSTGKHDKVYARMLERLLPSGSWESDGSNVTIFPERLEGRAARVARGIQAVINELPDVPSHEKDFEEEGWSERESQHVRRFFETSDQVRYRVSFARNDWQGEFGIWEVSFGQGHPRKSRRTTEVLAGVGGVMQNFVREFSPTALYFSGTTGSRDAVYDMLLKRFAKGQWENVMGIRYLILKKEKWEKVRSKFIDG